MKGKKIYNRRKDTDAAPGRQRENDPVNLPREQPKRTDHPPLEA